MPLRPWTAPERRTLVTSAAVLLWIVVAASGVVGLFAYAGKPGAEAAASATWPAGSTLQREAGRPTLVMFAHPQCPCSRASLEELAQLFGAVGTRATTHVVFYRPSSVAAGWERTSLWQAAAALPGVRSTVDVDAVEAARFDALVSGQTFLYGADGRLLFSGGITPARGHVGDNAGITALEALLTGGRTAPVRTPVFGCALRQDLRR